jgi:hypothetical protein
VQNYAAELKDMLRESMLDWVDRLGEAAEKDIEDALAYFQKRLERPRAAEGETSLEAIAGRIANFRERVLNTEMPHTAAQEILEPHPVSGRLRESCSICRRAAAALSDFMRQQQFALSALKSA